MDYKRYLGGLSTKEIDDLLSNVIKAKIPNFPIPWLGAILYMVILGVKVGAIFKLLTMRKERIDLELLVEKQLNEQDTHHAHDSEVLI